MRTVQNAIGFDKEGELPFRCEHYSPIKEAFDNAVSTGHMTRDLPKLDNTKFFEYLGDKFAYQPGSKNPGKRHHIFRHIKDRTLKFVEAPKDYKPTPPPPKPPRPTHTRAK